MLRWERINLHLRDPFRLSYGTSVERTAYWIRLGQDEGWGEGTIPPYYHISYKEMEDYWDQAALKSEPFPNEVSEIAKWVDPNGSAPARCALDLALHDRLARKEGVPLYQLLKLPAPGSKASSFTISIDTPEIMAEQAKRVSKYPIIKVKLGGDNQDFDRLQAIRETRPDALIRVDANAGWTFQETMNYLDKLSLIGLELLEQPLDAKDIDGLGKLQSNTEIPIVADESVRSMQDIEDLARVGVRGVNIKLMKVGGIGRALRMIDKAKELGLKIMLGCMIETSLGITAMAHLSGIAEWIDLDASVLVTNDPFDGMLFDDTANIHVPDRPGIGVVTKSL